MIEIKKIKAADIKKKHKEIESLTPSQKDFLLASLLVSFEKLAEIVSAVLPTLDLTPKEKKEIEKSISVGPSWLNVSIKTKKEVRAKK